LKINHSTDDFNEFFKTIFSISAFFAALAHGIRISLNAPASMEHPEVGQHILKALIDNPPSMAMDA
jgi:hypothetical protein